MYYYQHSHHNYALILFLYNNLKLVGISSCNNVLPHSGLSKFLGMDSCKSLFVDNLAKLQTIPCQCKQTIDIPRSGIMLLALCEPGDSGNSQDEENYALR